MATIGVHRLMGDVQKAINYILNPSKTKNHLNEAYGCSAYGAGVEWKIKNKKNCLFEKDKKNIVGYHFRQSFASDTVSPEEAFEISKEWIKKITNGQFDYVIATHVDRKHVHTHIIVSPYNNVTGKRMNLFFKKDVPLFKKMSDEICLKHGLDVLPLDNNYSKNVSYIEWLIKNNGVSRGDSQKDILKKTIDDVIYKVKDYEEFKQYFTVLGFKVEDGSEEYNSRSGLRIQFPDGKKFIRCKNLGENYSLETIKSRIRDNGIYETPLKTKRFFKIQSLSEETINPIPESLKKKFSKKEYMAQKRMDEIMELIERINEMDAVKEDLARWWELDQTKEKILLELDNLDKIYAEYQNKYSEMYENFLEDDQNLLLESKLKGFENLYLKRILSKKNELKEKLKDVNWRLERIHKWVKYYEDEDKKEEEKKKKRGRKKKK